MQGSRPTFCKSLNYHLRNIGHGLNEEMDRHGL